MKCSDNRLVIYLNGVPMGSELDIACIGEQHLYTTTTTLIKPTYKWSLDGISPPKDLLGTNSSYLYTFDNKKHQLYVVATGEECAIEKSINVKGKVCNILCPIKCLYESVDIPSGILTGLVDINDKMHLIPGNNRFECSTFSNANAKAVLAIQTMIKNSVPCDISKLKVSYYKQLGNNNCLRIKIINSPIKFKSIIINGQIINFELNNC